MDTMVGDKNITELFGRKYNNCIIPLAMIRTNSSHYRMRMAVILKCTVLLTMLIIYCNFNSNNFVIATIVGQIQLKKFCNCHYGRAISIQIIL